MRTIDIVIDRLGKVTLSDSLLGMVGEHNNAKLCVRSEEGFFSDADFFRMCFGRYETAALYPVDGVIEYLVPGAVTGSTTKSWQLAGYRFDGQTPSLVKKSEVAAFALLPSAQPQAEIDPDISGTIEEEIQTLSGLVDDAKALAQTVTAKLNQAAGYYVPKEVGKGLSSNDYTDGEKAAVATIADKLNLPLYDVGNIDANTLTTPGIYAVSYAGPQNFPFTDSGAMPLLIVAESGRMPDISSGSPDFSNAKTLLQICIGKGGEVYSRYKIAGSGDLSDWSWSAWSTKAVSVTNSLGSGSTTAALSAAQGKALDEKKVDKMSGKGLSTNDYTDAEKNKVASAISETDAKAAFAAKGKLTDCHGFDGAGIYSIPYNAANLPDGVSFPQDKNAMLVVTYSNNMSWTNYEYSMTLILPDGVVYTQQRMGEKDYASFTAWTRAYSDKQDKAWQTLANLTVAEEEEASSIKIALPDAITTCNELMIEAEFYVGSEKTTQWRPTFWFADVDKTKYNCWLGGGGNGSVTPGTKYYFELYGWVGDSRLLTFYGPANQHMHANSRATAYMARTSLGYRSGHSSYTCYLHMEIGSNTFAAGTKIKLLGR